MYALVQGHQYGQYEHLLEQYFRLRKTVFADQLGWNIRTCGAYERDRFDDLKPPYLIWCDDNWNQLYGAVRLLATTGPTLLYDVFRPTSDLVAPSIWEGTRMCVDEEALQRDLPELRVERAFCLLLLSLCEAALDSGIQMMISNYEPHMRRIYEHAGAEFDELGRADGYGKYPVCCGAFEVSERVLANMRCKMKISGPLYSPTAFPRAVRPMFEARPA
ncbi:acyl-homoserine-lactone synthase [Sinorhizobium chiapasense]|uniref:Acyl-homoserine-lactone synthase n=1 Tax=Sinorhizobium chiapasense TaxID=501572 RepID=A0ABZ2BJ83_9HYPH